MEPFPTTAVAVEWAFRCQRKEIPDAGWTWQCKSQEGALVAKSAGAFRSLREAMADARRNGFTY